jgi:hypothetical protein
MTKGDLLLTLVRSRLSASSSASPSLLLEPPPASIQEALSHLRAFCGFTEAELGDYLSIRATRISDVENRPGQGLAPRALQALADLARDYHRPITEMFLRREAARAMDRVARQGGRQ